MDRTAKKVFGWVSVIGCGLFALGAGGVALLFAVLFTGFDREVVTHPDATITATDEDGVAIGGARVVFVWSSYPYHETRDTLDLTAGEDGRATIEKRTMNERIFPFCMHGVPEHVWDLCVEADGRAPVVLHLTPSDAPLDLRVSLRPSEDAEDTGPDAPHCDDLERPWYRVAREDLRDQAPTLSTVEELHAREPD